MLLTQATLKGIEDGSITLAFRRWRRPTVTEGGTLLTPIGQLAVESVDLVAIDDITASEASAAGFPDLDTLRTELSRRPDGSIYRVRLSVAGPDPRIALRAEIPGDDELLAIVDGLRRYDSRAASGPWTCLTLQVIHDRPGVRAADLAASAGTERKTFKNNVRKLKGHGLTESMRVGYRLSPRGEAVLKKLQGGAT